MTNKILFFAVVLMITSCFDSKIKYGQVTEPQVILTSESGKTMKESMLIFDQFVQDLSNNREIQLASDLHERAKLYFPDTTIFDNHYLFGHEIPYRDSFRLLLYEYSSDDSPHNYMYLSSFGLDGKAVDVLKTATLTAHDGNISINLVDGEYLEVEYADFQLRPSFFESKRYQERVPDSLKTSVGNPVTKFKNYTRSRDFEETIFYKYYQINSKGEFVLLNNATSTHSSRKYPIASTKILSFEELEQLSNVRLNYMKNEILAVHGFIFSSSEWKRRFKRKRWYKPEFTDVSDLLSDIERINIAKIEETALTYSTFY